MAETLLMKGNEALAKAAILAGCDGYFGYPITPQSEILEYMARELPKAGGVMVQAESELAAINMVYGASGAGGRVMTSSSSPGISLMQEGISYMASAQLPCLLVNVNRGGPGLGTIQPAQGDYFQAVKGGGHGDYNIIVLAPASVQEMADFTYLAFDLADKYLTPVLILADGALGQMMEKVTFPEYDPAEHKQPKPWATTGKPRDRERNIITSLHIEPEQMEKINNKLQAKYRLIKQQECRWNEYHTEDAEYALVAFGLSARICRKVVELARTDGHKVGLFRPQTLFPYPTTALSALTEQVKMILTVEMNAGQMVEDVRQIAAGRVPVEFYGRTGGVIPSPDEVYQHLRSLIQARGKQATTNAQEPAEAV
ncbi:MAG: 3-methyl-2-oxobutanoate dehydrogenase subunit VorB [Candidatus Marinimicrobia bacterium]|nr:3-methyl-2-oxobutanoate dehydrogenase subunit VorB [Candidatus Neomarinimicrobiota bacterium]